MSTMVPKSVFAEHALEWLQRLAATGEEIFITEDAAPVAKLVPCANDPLALLHSLRGTVVKYDDATAPVGDVDWESLR